MSHKFIPSPLLFLFLFLNISCSGHLPKKHIPPRQYSKEVELSFQEIEAFRAIESYRLMRLRDLEKKKTSPKRKKVRRPFILKLRPKKIKKRTYPKGDPREISTELQQNLIYYCMGQRRKNKFEEKSDCQVFAHEQLGHCQKKYTKEDDKRVIRCLKSKLRR